MYFNIDADEGRVIRGWIVLDNPAAAPRLRLVIPDRPEIAIEAHHHRPDIQEMGIHLTGHVGFYIDEAVVPDLAALDDVSLLESESRLLIFRRSRPHHLNGIFSILFKMLCGTPLLVGADRFRRLP